MPRSLVPSRGRSRSLGLLLIVGLFLAACAGASGGAPLAPAGNGDGENPGGARNPTGGQPQTGSTGNGSTVGLYDINQANLLIIKTGTLQLQVMGLDAALAAAGQKIAALGGYVSGSQRHGDDDAAVASVIYRFPAARWDEALVALRALGVKVLGEESQTQDVTGQVVDLGARITNLQATERSLQAIMTKATKITDVLAVQDQLTNVRGQIEQLSAERKHLSEQAAYSTLSVTFSLKEQAVAATTEKFDPTSEIDRASASLVDVLQGLATAGIWFGIVWLPILIVLGIIAFVASVILRRVLRARPDGPSGPASPLPAPAAEG
jgi:hypothetical protein